MEATAMSPGQPDFERVNEIFSEALELPDAQRPAFIRRRSDRESMYLAAMEMLATYRELGSFLAEPAVRSAPLSDTGFCEGDILDDRFRILERVGRGGMGEVYRAKDDLSGEFVAVKTLHSKLIGDRSAEERFRQELTLARKISHSNVCRIYELFAEQRGAERILYFTMEYLEGETLAEKLGRGALTSAETLAIARQIAAGIDAAHAVGILHRDLKPSNVYLAGERVVLTDFGLAKALHVMPEVRPTITGQAPGTPAYMAPEQFLGDNLTPQSDVFAFGLIVFEMLTGRPPYPREDVGSAIRRVSQSLPPRWERVIDRALNSIPDKRYRSAGAMVRELERLEHPAALLSVQIGRRNIFVGGGIAAVSLASFFAVPRLREWGASLPASPLLMMTPLTHSSNAVNAHAMDLLLSSQLTQSAHVRLLPAEEIASAWRRITGSKSAPPAQLEPKMLRDAALRRGVHFVVFGNLGSTGDEDVLRLRVELMGDDPGHARKTWDRDFTAQARRDLPSAAFEGASWIRQTVGEGEPELRVRSRRPEEMTTSSWQALEEFTKADQAWSARDSAAATLHLNTALDLDPAFALAAFRMGDILTAVNRSDEALPYYEKAAGFIQRKNLTDRESLRIRGLFLLDTHQCEEAERVFTRWGLEYPRDALPFFYKATSVERQGRFAEAIALGRRAIELDSSRAVFLQAHAERLLNSGRIAEAETETKRLAAVESNDWTDILQSALAVGRCDLGEAWRRLEHLRESGSVRFQSLSYVFRACFRAEQKQYGEAERLYREGLEFDAVHGLRAEPTFKKRQLAQLYLRQGRNRDAIRMVDEILSGKPGNQLTMEAGCILAQAGDPQAARKCLRPALPGWPIYRHWSLRLEGAIALARGDAKRGLELMKRAPSIVVGAWREDILNAAIAAKDGDAVRTSLDALFTNPGCAWRTAQFGSTGFMVRAAETAEKFDLPEMQARTASLLRKSFAAKISV